MSGERVNRPSPGGDGADDLGNARFLGFGAFTIDLVRRRLTHAGKRLDIQRKPLDVLIHLARNSGRVVSRSELLEAHWRGQVHDEALTRCIGIVRRALDDARDPPHYVETVWGQGYRFIAPVTAGRGSPAGGEAAEPPVTDERQAKPPEVAPPVDASRRVAFTAAAVAMLAMLITAIVLAWQWFSTYDTPPQKRIAVLPMAWEAPDDEWLARALTDQLAATIARIEGVTVISQFTGDATGRASDPVAIGRRLGVESVLTSRLVRADPGVGLSARLVSVDDGKVLWSFSPPSRSAEADPAMIGQLVDSVARQLWADLHVPRPAAEVAPEAYREYLRARYYWHQRTETGLRAAIEAYEQVLAREPAFAEAHAGLAESWLLLPLYAAVAPMDAIPRAREAATRALELDPRQARALGVLGVIAMQFDWDWSRAESLLRQALTLQPNDATTEQWLGELYCYQRRFDECRQHLRVAQGLEPLSPVLRMLAASPDLWSGRYENAVAAYGAALDDVPGFPLALYALGMSHAGLGQWSHAAANYRAAEPALGLAVTGGPLIHALARMGEEDLARAQLEDLRALADVRYVPPSKLAIAWLGLGDTERALEWLRRAVEVRDDRVVYLAVDPHFGQIHANPEFRRMLAEVALLDALERH